MYILNWVGGYGSLEFTFANLCCTPSSALHCKLWATFTTVDLATLLIALGNPTTAWQQQDIVQKLFLRCLGWQWARYYSTILVCSFSATECQFTLIWYEGVVSKIHNVKPFSDNFSKIFFPFFIIGNDSRTTTYAQWQIWCHDFYKCSCWQAKSSAYFYPPFLPVVSTLYVCLYQLHFLSFSIFLFLPSGQICSIRTQKQLWAGPQSTVFFHFIFTN